MLVYVTVYRHIGGTQYIQLNATYEGQQKFIEGLSRNFVVESISCDEVED